MTHRNFHTFKSVSQHIGREALEDLYTSILNGETSQYLVDEIIQQCNTFTRHLDASRDTSIISRFNGFVRVAFEQCYTPDDLERSISALANFDGDHSASLSVIISKTNGFIGRDSSGSPRPIRSYGNLCKYVYSIRKIFSEAIKYDDLEVATLLLSSKRIHKIIDSNLHNLIVRTGVKGGACERLIQSKPASINEYVMTLNKFAMSNNADLAKSYYDKSLTPIVGHLQISLLLETTTKTSMLLLNSLLRDKADWYMGVCQKYLGAASYFDLHGRTPDPVNELKHFYQLVRKADRNAAIKAIWRSIPEEVVLSLAESPKIATDLHGLTGHHSLLRFTSNDYRRTSVENDLGV